MAVQWPAAAVDSGGDDLLPPTRSFLEKLNVLEKEGERVTPIQTPQSLQVVTAGSTALSKTISTLVAALGGGTVVWAAVKGFWIAQPENQRIAYIWATALIVSAVAIALAIIVHADVRGRSVASAAEYEARANIAKAFLQTSAQIAEARYLLKKKGQDGWFDVKSFGKDDSKGFYVKIEGDTVYPDEIEHIERLAASKP